MNVVRSLREAVVSPAARLATDERPFVGRRLGAALMGLVY